MGFVRDLVFACSLLFAVATSTPGSPLSTLFGGQTNANEEKGVAFQSPFRKKKKTLQVIHYNKLDMSQM